MFPMTSRTIRSYHTDEGKKQKKQLTSKLLTLLPTCGVITHDVHGSTALSDAVCVDDIYDPAQHPGVWCRHTDGALAAVKH